MIWRTVAMVLVGVTVAAGVFGLAASLGVLTTVDLFFRTERVDNDCDTSFTVGTSQPGGAGTAITQVTIKAIDTGACVGQTVVLQIKDTKGIIQAASKPVAASVTFGPSADGFPVTPSGAFTEHVLITDGAVAIIGTTVTITPP